MTTTTDTVKPLTAEQAELALILTGDFHGPWGAGLNEIAERRHTVIDTAELERLRKAARRLHLFEEWANEGYAPALVFDDDGRWAVSFTSASPVPPDGGFTDTEQISVLVEPHEWHDSVNAAIDAAQKEEGQ
ncbi:hypothetical protein [Algiphilus sp.]|uniref:hypothetical protein n=1 Tax=Algiphilus sp. TaxID=1872431 RepID=UPI003BAC7E8B